jgi:hypothetical protein
MRFEMRRGMRPGERLQRGIDFVGDMDASDQLVAVAAKATVKDTGADVTSTVISDAIVTGRTTAKATIQNLQAGLTYLVALHGTTVMSAEGFEHDIEIECKADA